MSGMRTKPLDGELLKIKEEILKYALDFGLDFYEVIFEVCDYDTINILAAQGGFPARYPHWQFGMQYDQLSKGYTYGMQKIYEMVVNTKPCYAYLLNANHLVDQKTVMSHVYGHADFFKNNYWFSNTDRNMMDVMANHGTKIRRYMGKYGQDTVESFIDKILSLEDRLDINYLFETEELKRRRKDLEVRARQESQEDQDDDRSMALKSFMRTKNNEHKAKDKADEESAENLNLDSVVKKDKLPTKDILLFLLQNAPIKEWQSDIIGMMREESYYFLPQRMTKIMNEGWASYWHSKIMTEKAMRASELVDFCDHHAGVMAMSKQNINPYKIGIELFRDIEHRWDTGKFGKEYNECSSMQEKSNWDRKLGLGRQKIFEVRKTHNDITFIDEFFTKDFCERMQLFTYKFNPRTGKSEIETRDFEMIKTKLLTQLTNFGTPVITLTEDNFENRGELLLQHGHQGVDLDLKYMSETLKNLQAVWKRPVHLKTLSEGKDAIFSHNGKELKQGS
jgi:stage V sporulation protein R